MSVSIATRVEGARGCGYRKGGGLYLVAPGLGELCDRLPLPVTVCPTCKHGIKPARGWTWVDGDELFGHELHGSMAHNATCPLGPLDHDLRAGSIIEHITREHPASADSSIAVGEYDVATYKDWHEKQHKLGEVGLLWIGEKFYPTPAHFSEEAARMGVSRRITAIPKGLKVGESWVFLGHRKAVPEWIVPEKPTAAERILIYTPGIFRVFKPTAIEYVVKGDEPEEELEALVKRGLTLVKVERAQGPEQQEMFEEPEEEEV